MINTRGRDDLNWLPLRSSHLQRNNYFYFAFVALCGALQTHFHGRGRNGKRQMQRRFLRKRGAAGNTPSVFAAQSQLPQGDALWQCRKLCRRRQKPSPWGRWLDAKRQDGRGKLPPRGSCQNRQVLTEGVPSCEKNHNFWKRRWAKTENQHHCLL